MGSLVALSVAASVVGALPLNLTGALAFEIERDLAFGAFGIGLAVATFRIVQGLSASRLGKVVDDLGARLAFGIASALTVLCALVVTFGARSLVVLLVAMAIGGVGKSLMQPASNRMVVTEARADQYGIVIGFKQSAAPLSTLLAGLAVTVIAAGLGWRWIFAATALAAVFVCVLVLVVMDPDRPATGSRTSRSRLSRQELQLLTLVGIAMALANATSSIVPAFWVLGETRSGGSAATAGVVLAMASAVAVALRIVSGVLCDRIPGRHLDVCAAMLVTGAVGLLLVALADTTNTRAAGLVMGYAGVWGYPAVLWFAMLKRFPTSPGQVTGRVTVWSLVGGSAGPVLFGLIADHASFTAAWLMTASLGLASAVLMSLASRRMMHN